MRSLTGQSDDLVRPPKNGHPAVESRSQEFDRLRGLLILLVVLGHNSYFNSLYHSIYVMIYFFHVTCFFYITIFFSKKKTFKEVLEKNLAIVINYVIAVVICFIAFSLYSADRNFWMEQLKLLPVSLVIGSPALLKSTSGFALFWYVPAFIGVTLLVQWLERLRQFRVLVLILCEVAALSLLNMPQIIVMWIPLGMSIIPVLLLPGYIVRSFIKSGKSASPFYTMLFVATALVFGSCLFHFSVTYNLSTGSLTANQLPSQVALLLVQAFSVLIFLTLLQIMSLFGRCRVGRLFAWFGRHSFGIYLYHSLFFQGWNSLLSKSYWGVDDGLLLAVSFTLTTVTSSVAVWLIPKLWYHINRWFQSIGQSHH